LERKNTSVNGKTDKALRSWLYMALLAAIIAGSAAAYLGWWSNFRSFRPEFSTAEPLLIKETAKTDSVLLWGEIVIVSPAEGKVHYPFGIKPARVSKGETVAVVRTGNRDMDVKAPQSGYFVPGLDGLEGKWTFSGTWPGDGQLPTAGNLSLKLEGTRIYVGKGLGKLVPQPQDLRAIAYLGMDEGTRGQIKRGFVLFSLAGERPQKALIRAVQDYGPKAKIYITLPYFPMEVMSSRLREIEFFHGERKGVVLPESAILQKSGGMGVFAFDSGKLEYRGVKGQPLPGSRFLVTEGLKAGELVLSRASLGAERKVLLW
jgi:hypothetical protein